MHETLLHARDHRTFQELPLTQWRCAHAAGHTMLGLRSDWQAHMARSAREIGVQGLRMHGALDDDLSITPHKGEYHFYSLDVVYDNMLANGVRPIVELSFMPAALVSCGTKWPNGTAQPTCDWAFGVGVHHGANGKKEGPGSYRGLAHPPDDFEDWYNLVKATAAHMVDRHGLASRRRDCHFADIPSPSILKHLLEGEGGAAE